VNAPRTSFVVVAFVGLAVLIVWNAHDNAVMRRETANAAERAAKRAAIEKQLDESDARIAAEKVARSFPERKIALFAKVEDLKRFAAAKKWSEAEAASAALQTELTTLRKSSIAASKDVEELAQRFDAARRSLAPHEEEVRLRREARDKEENAKFAAYNAADPKLDLTIVRSSWKKGGFDTVAIWSVTIRNNNKAASYADIAYSTNYSGASGTLLAKKNGVIFDVLMSGKTRTFEVNDGFVDGQVQRAGLQLTGASKRMP
jgi:hypothetical protein